ncbi:hypothetical protein cypCar_00000121, partial [Cyprinus carpio]
MKCVIEGNGVKVFGKAVHALSRIGDEIWLDPLEKGLAVRTVNSSQSAYACFCFTPLFFQQYIPDPDIRKDCEAVKCKLNMKCVLPLFRCASWRERSVDKCEISINIPNSRVIFQFHCRHDLACLLSDFIKGMNTELMLHPDEFDYFQVGEDSAVTFCLKELR